MTKNRVLNRQVSGKAETAERLCVLDGVGPDPGLTRTNDGRVTGPMPTVVSRTMGSPLHNHNNTSWNTDRVCGTRPSKPSFHRNGP